MSSVFPDSLDYTNVAVGTMVRFLLGILWQKVKGDEQVMKEKKTETEATRDNAMYATEDAVPVSSMNELRARSEEQDAQFPLPVPHPLPFHEDE